MKANNGSPLLTFILAFDFYWKLKPGTASFFFFFFFFSSAGVRVLRAN